MKGILIRSMANILGVNKEFKYWQAVLFFSGALGLLALVMIVSVG